jgi:hypothetical protein
LASFAVCETSYGHICADSAEELTQGFAKDVLVGATARAAPGQLAVDHDSGQASHAVLLSAARNAFLVHVVNLDFMVRAHDFPDHIDGFLAGGASGAEDFDFVLLGHNFSPLQFWGLADALGARSCQPDGPAIPERCGDKNAQSRIRGCGRVQVELSKEDENTRDKTREGRAVAAPLTSAECEGSHGDDQEQRRDNQEVSRIDEKTEPDRR